MRICSPFQFGAGGAGGAACAQQPRGRAWAEPPEAMDPREATEAMEAMPLARGLPPLASSAAACPGRGSCGSDSAEPLQLQQGVAKPDGRREAREGGEGGKEDADTESGWCSEIGGGA